MIPGPITSNKCRCPTYRYTSVSPPSPRWTAAAGDANGATPQTKVLAPRGALTQDDTSEPGGPVEQARPPSDASTHGVCPRFVLTMPDGSTWLLCTLSGRKSTSQPGRPLQVRLPLTPKGPVPCQKPSCATAGPGRLRSGQAAHSRPACSPARAPSGPAQPQPQKQRNTWPAGDGINQKGPRGRVSLGEERKGEGERRRGAFPPLRCNLNQQVHGRRAHLSGVWL